jgi:hypothetical protein
LPAANTGRIPSESHDSTARHSASSFGSPEGVYDPRPGLPYQATCTGGNRNGFYGAGNVNALNAVQ